MAKNEKIQNMSAYSKEEWAKLKAENEEKRIEEVDSMGINTDELRQEQDLENLGISVDELQANPTEEKIKDVAKAMAGLEKSKKEEGISINDLDGVKKYINEALVLLQKENRGNMSEDAAAKAIKDLERWKDNIKKTRTSVISQTWKTTKAS